MPLETPVERPTDLRVKAKLTVAPELCGPFLVHLPLIAFKVCLSVIYKYVNTIQCMLLSMKYGCHADDTLIHCSRCDSFYLKDPIYTLSLFASINVSLCGRLYPIQGRMFALSCQLHSIKQLLRKLDKILYTQPDAYENYTAL